MAGTSVAQAQVTDFWLCKLTQMISMYHCEVINVYRIQQVFIFRVIFSKNDMASLFNTMSDLQYVTTKVRLNNPAFKKHKIVVLCQS